MTCMNCLLTICSVLIFVFAVWPGYGGEVLTDWVIGVASLVILIVAWTGVECKICSVKKKKKK